MANLVAGNYNLVIRIKLLNLTYEYFNCIAASADPCDKCPPPLLISLNLVVVTVCFQSLFENAEQLLWENVSFHLQRFHVSICACPSMVFHIYRHVWHRNVCVLPYSDLEINPFDVLYKHSCTEATFPCDITRYCNGLVITFLFHHDHSVLIHTSQPLLYIDGTCEFFKVRYQVFGYSPCITQSREHRHKAWHLFQSFDGLYFPFAFESTCRITSCICMKAQKGCTVFLWVVASKLCQFSPVPCTSIKQNCDTFKYPTIVK